MSVETATCKSCHRRFTRTMRSSGVQLYCTVCPVGRLKYSTRLAQKGARDTDKESLAQIQEFGHRGVGLVWDAMDRIATIYR